MWTLSKSTRYNQSSKSGRNISNTNTNTNTLFNKQTNMSLESRHTGFVLIRLSLANLAVRVESKKLPKTLQEAGIFYQLSTWIKCGVTKPGSVSVQLVCTNHQNIIPDDCQKLATSISLTPQEEVQMFLTPTGQLTTLWYPLVK